MTASPRPERPRSLEIDEIVQAVAGLTLATPPTAPTARTVSTEAPLPTRLSGVTLDSRGVLPGDLYAALPGARVHGGRFAAQAVDSGAVAVLTDETGARMVQEAGVAVPVLLAADPRAVLGEVAATIYGRPAEGLTMFGITGTNGKTTTAYLLEGALAALGERPGLIGTIETRVGSRRLPSVRTTPEASELHGLLAVMRESGCTSCCMEVSSHALALHRVDAVRYDVSIFTNLSQDHLDFHRTMEGYFEAKADLFTPQRAARGVVCVDDDWGARLARQAQIPVTTLAAASAAERGADWMITPLPPGEPATHDDVGAGDADGAGGPFGPGGPGGAVRLRHADGRELTVRVGLPGAHNATNTALAVVALLESGYPAADVTRAFERPARVPGRMQHVDLTDLPRAQDPRASGRSAPRAYVDFAHTPDAVAATLTALRHVSAGPLVAVLGAGGDRDPGKRPAMGAAAARVADAVVVTDDNPRHEDPVAIRASVAGGARAQSGDAVVHDVPGRQAGIALAVDLAAGRDGSPAGVVAVLGKGHEQGQTIGDVTTPFDDAQVIAAAWANLSGGAAHGTAARPDPEVTR